MRQIFITKYKGTTLVEVMVALALTSFAATLAVVIYLNIQKSTVPFFKLKAMELAGKCLEETIEQKDFFDKTLETEGFLIKKTVLRDPFYYDCHQVKVAVYDQEKKKLTELSTTVYAE